MKKIIDVGENDILFMSDGNSLVKVDINDLPDYEEPKEEAKEEPSLYPADGTNYYYINVYGQIIPTTFEGCEVDLDMFDTGNGFLTKEAAEFEFERRKVIAKMKLYAEPFDTKWTGIIGDTHYRIVYDVEDKEIGIDNTDFVKGSDLYFPSKEQAQKAIDAVGEDNVKKYYLGVIE